MRIRRFDRSAALGGPYWVGMELPADREPCDFTLVPITHRYVTKGALLRAIADGTALLAGDPERVVSHPARTGKEWA